jgi:NADH-quinone oxidoreductase subunit M
MHAYFRIFAGTPHVTSIDLMIRLAERIAVLVLTVLILGGGLFPQPGITFCHRAAVRLVRSRNSAAESPSHAGSHARLPARTQLLPSAASDSGPLAEAGIAPVPAV